MTKLNELIREKNDLLMNIEWSENNFEALQEDESLKELYLFELKELEEVCSQIEFIKELEQQGIHENKITELYNLKYPVEEIIETVTQTLGNNGAKKEITLFNNGRILTEKYENNRELKYQMFSYYNINYLKINDFSNKIYDIKGVD